MPLSGNIVLPQNLVNSLNSKGETPLWLAVLRGNTVGVKTLLDNGGDINVTLDDTTLTQLAKDKGHKEIIQLLEMRAQHLAHDSKGQNN